MRVVKVRHILVMGGLYAVLKILWAMFDSRTLYHLGSASLTISLLAALILFCSFKARKDDDG